MAGPVSLCDGRHGELRAHARASQAEDALTFTLFINAFRPAFDLPLLGEAVSLRTGRKPLHATASRYPCWRIAPRQGGIVVIMQTLTAAEGRFPLIIFRLHSGHVTHQSVAA
jgi:hypothetical protein